MPRIGSLTQSPRQITRFGANIVPLCGQGFVRRAGEQPQAYPAGLRFGAIGIGYAAPAPKKFAKPQFYGRFRITGITRDGAGVALGVCRVDLFKFDALNTWLDYTISDGSGNYSFSLGENSSTFYTRAYKAGAPDVAGTSLNTLVAT